MKKNMIKSVILAILMIIVIVSLVGCVKLQKKTAEKTDTTKAEETASKEAEKAMSTVEDEIKETEKEITDAGETAKTADEADEILPEPAVDDSLPVKRVKEGELVNFPNLQATDPDGDPITYTFTSPLDTKGEWQTRVGDAGEHVITITASDGKNEVSQKVRIIVEALNKAPVITLGGPKEIMINEGETVKLEVQAIDPDNDPVKITFSGWMDSAEKTASFDDAGTHKVTITASDGKSEAQEDVTIIINNVNRAPKLSALADITVKEGESIKIDAEAQDPDGDDVTITFSTPLGANDGIWDTKIGDAGKYEVTVTATDGELTDQKTFKITVQSLNKPPVIELESATITVNEGEIVTINAKITDPENDELTIRYSGWMTSSTYQTDYDDAGTHVVTITASDKLNTVTQDVTIIVADVNRPPQFNPDAFN